MSLPNTPDLPDNDDDLDYGPAPNSRTWTDDELRAEFAKNKEGPYFPLEQVIEEMYRLIADIEAKGAPKK